MKVLALALLLAAWCTGAAANDGLRRVGGHDLTLVFEDTFDAPSIDIDARGAGWVPWFHKFNVRTLKGNQELQLYSDPNNLVRLGLPATLDPFLTADGVLTIRGSRVAPALRTKLPVVAGAPPLEFVSGMISSELTFAQTYGYFEARVRLSDIPGTWPAFWLLPKSGGWPPEIDIFEVIGQEPRRVHQNVINADKSSAHTHLDIAGTTTDWHTFALLWTPQSLLWFVDGMQTKREPNTIHEDMYMILNLAVGGRWPGTPPGDAPFPARIQIDDVRAYALVP